MKTVKELAKILEECDCKHSAEHCDICPYIGEEGCLSYVETAKKLVEHGVTIATDTKCEWVSVDERLPIDEVNRYREKYGELPEFIVLIKGACEPTCLMFTEKGWVDREDNVYTVAYWQPLPEPQKGVQ